ncbi:MAG: exo-beta-N-acetylmuramidase NamZ domain-containing protein [Saprospiraceae bacterium]
MKLKILVVILVIFGWACNRKIQNLPPKVTPVPKQDSTQVIVEQPVPKDTVPAPVVKIDTLKTDTIKKTIVVGAARIAEYLPLLKDKTIAMVVNQTSMVGETHVVDTLLSLGVKIKAIFAPEHGFRGTASDGEKVASGKDPKTGVAILSLYGKKLEPSAEDLAGVDWVLFDIQDVGTRFYTYISTMHYVMRACAKNKVKFMVLDRPNPNGHFVDGPMLDTTLRSFVGMHKIPVVHGMTIGEYAQMLIGENWLDDNLKPELKVITCDNYNHDSYYSVPIKPSPNLPNDRAILLYPSICFFEGVTASIGRGTNKQFQVYGSPGFPKGDFTFTPEPMEGSINPPLKGQLCRGYDLTNLSPDSIWQERRINLSYLLDFYKDFPNKDSFFLKTLYIDKLAGTTEFRKQIIAGKTEAEIRASWQPGLEKFKAIRKKYLLYKDFE